MANVGDRFDTAYQLVLDLQNGNFEPKKKEDDFGMPIQDEEPV